MVRHSVVILLLLTVGAAAQTGGPTKAKTPAKSATATPAKPPTAVLHTTAGDMKCELFPDKAPKTVESFIGLSTGKKDWKNPANGQTEHNHPLYDGVIFHRVIPGFMIQGGDPKGDGTGGPGYEFENEVTPDLVFDKPGRLAMANAGPNTNGSQFFITETPQMRLNGGYTIFGQCDDATVELVKKIAQGPCHGTTCSGNNFRADNPAKITHIEIQNPPKATKPSAKHPTKKKTSTKK